MDPWNPLIAETHVKRVPFWQAALGEAALVVALVGIAWALVVFLLQIDQFAPWLVSK